MTSDFERCAKKGCLILLPTRLETARARATAIAIFAANFDCSDP